MMIADRKSGTNTREIVFRSLMSICKLGPAVSFQGSPTVSPTTVAACVSVFFPPKCPISTYFFALSIAAPPHIIIMASGIAEIVAPTTRAPTAAHPRILQLLLARQRGSPPEQPSTVELS